MNAPNPLQHGFNCGSLSNLLKEIINNCTLYKIDDDESLEISHIYPCKTQALILNYAIKHHLKISMPLFYERYATALRLHELESAELLSIEDYEALDTAETIASLCDEVISWHEENPSNDSDALFINLIYFYEKIFWPERHGPIALKECFYNSFSSLISSVINYNLK